MNYYRSYLFICFHLSLLWLIEIWDSIYQWLVDTVFHMEGAPCATCCGKVNWQLRRFKVLTKPDPQKTVLFNIFKMKSVFMVFYMIKVEFSCISIYVFFFYLGKLILTLLVIIFDMFMYQKVVPLIRVIEETWLGLSSVVYNYKIFLISLFTKYCVQSTSIC